MRHTRLVLLLLALGMVLLTACAGDDNDSRPLPTLIELPTDAPATADDPTPTAEALAAQPTPLPTDMPATDAPAADASPTVTPSLTITPTPSRTPTATPTPTLTPTDAPEVSALSLLLELALQATILPPDFLGGQGQGPAISPPTVPPGGVQPPAAGQCPYLPAGGFGRLVLNEPLLLTQIGCPVGEPPVTLTQASAVQTFERGLMVWISDTPGSIYVLYSDGRYQRFDDTFVDGADPERGGENPPAGLLEPVRGFGKVWRNNPAVRDGLGWATEAERGGQSTTQTFGQGRMIDVPQRGVILLLLHAGDASAGTYRLVAERF